ncbi:hypothetical protein CLOLEP_02179 [[Clostridium] leptum DSM 753]|uniref:Uncharacterized protein n=1 Tax=[Clostridium] leptum DSM 753 TaxID=428125 RepID=A7VUD3_9FIRM|nr:hypothetical protein CLOLEP_02179 [[Clostridium] leptum DSM 753]
MSLSALGEIDRIIIRTWQKIPFFSWGKITNKILNPQKILGVPLNYYF